MAEGANLEVLQAALIPPPAYESALEEPFEPVGPTLFQAIETPFGERLTPLRKLMEPSDLRSPGHTPLKAARDTILPRRLNHGAPTEPITEAVGDLSSWPFSAVGRITASFDGRLRYCTGSVVAERIVLTAAHCIYARSIDGEETAQFADWVRFEPQLKNDEALGTWAGTATYIHQGWSDPAPGTSPSPYDYAFIRLDYPIAAETGTISVLANSDMEGPFTSLGYPRGANARYAFNGRFLYATTGARVGSSSPGVMQAENELPEGSSGGPWLTAEGGGVSMAGLNSTKPVGDDTTTYSPMFSEGFLELFARVLADQTGV